MSACRAGTPRVFRPNPVRHFSQCRGGNVEVSIPALSMAWRLVVRLPSRNAARLSSGLVQRFSQCRGGTLKLAFRLFPWRGGSLSAYRADNNAATPRKFARKLAARPTGSAQHRREIERFRPYCFPDSGGLGATANASGHFPALVPLRFVG